MNKNFYFPPFKRFSRILENMFDGLIDILYLFLSVFGLCCKYHYKKGNNGAKNI